MSAAKQPQTAEEALGCIADILATLPEEELTELTCTFELDEGRRLSLAPDFALIDLIMDLPEQERRDLLTETVDLMPPKERRRWIGVFECSRPGMMGYLMVHTDLLGMVQGLIEKLTKEMVKGSESNGALRDEAKALRDKLRPFMRAAEARREAIPKRIEAIDALLDDGYLRSEIYEQMRQNHGGLIPGRGKDDAGRDKEYMEESYMWDSYKTGGGCHPKARRPRGRLRKKRR